jgi:hypothetical protein
MKIIKGGRRVGMYNGKKTKKRRGEYDGNFKRRNKNNKNAHLQRLRPDTLPNIRITHQPLYCIPSSRLQPRQAPITPPPLDLDPAHQARGHPPFRDRSIGWKISKLHRGATRDCVSATGSESYDRRPLMKNISDEMAFLFGGQPNLSRAVRKARRPSRNFIGGLDDGVGVRGGDGKSGCVCSGQGVETRIRVGCNSGSLQSLLQRRRGPPSPSPSPWHSQM